MEANKIDIGEMVEQLKVRKEIKGTTALFLGAKAGGLFRSSHLYETLRAFGTSGLHNPAPLERYHECYQVLSQRFELQDIHSILTKTELLQEIQAEVPELCVAELAKQHIFNRIFSVSIYEEFEEAFQLMGMKKTLDFEVASPKSNSAMSPIYPEPRSLFTLMKVFGGIASRDYNIKRRVKHLEENEALRKELNGLRDMNILIVGLDLVWDRYLIPSLFQCSGSGSVWYVNDEEPTDDLSEYLRACEAKYILGLDGHYENFFRKLCLLITGAVPAGQAAVEKVKKELGENQNTIQKLSDDVRVLSAEIRSLQSKLDQFLTSPSARSRARKANAASKNVEEQ